MDSFTQNNQFLFIFCKMCNINVKPDHFFDHLTYLNFFDILVPIDGLCFSHSHPEIWCSKIWDLQRNNQKRVK